LGNETSNTLSLLSILFSYFTSPLSNRKVKLIAFVNIHEEIYHLLRKSCRKIFADARSVTFDVYLSFPTSWRKKLCLRVCEGRRRKRRQAGGNAEVGGGDCGGDIGEAEGDEEGGFPPPSFARTMQDDRVAEEGRSVERVR